MGRKKKIQLIEFENFGSGVCGSSTLVPPFGNQKCYCKHYISHSARSDFREVIISVVSEMRSFSSRPVPSNNGTSHFTLKRLPNVRCRNAFPKKLVTLYLSVMDRRVKFFQNVQRDKRFPWIGEIEFLKQNIYREGMSCFSALQ